MNEENQQLKEELEKIKQPTIFIDTQDMEERWGEQLYQDYLEEQNKDLKDRINKAIEYIDRMTRVIDYNDDELITWEQIMSEIELILAKLRIVSEEKERGMYLCDKEHSKLLYDYITNLQQENQKLKERLHKIYINGVEEKNTSVLDLINENKELKDRIDKALKITNKILMNNADNRMICNEYEKEYFDWLDNEMLKQEKILKGSDNNA